MIKKFLGLISFMLVASLGYGESMDFVTVLSSPVGSFANLETANASFPATANKVNFGSRLSSGGTISLAGSTGPSLGRVVLDKNAGLSSTNAKEVRVPGVKGMRYCLCPLRQMPGRRMRRDGFLFCMSTINP